MKDCVGTIRFMTTSYCNGVKEGVQQFRKEQRSKSKAVEWLLDSGDTSKLNDIFKLFGNLASISNGLFGTSFSMGSWTDLNSGLNSIEAYSAVITPINNLMGGIRNLSPSVQLENFCEGKGFYGADISPDDTKSDSNDLVSLVVTRQNYTDCDLITENNGKEKCNEYMNQSRFVYLYTWNIGGFDVNVSYNIWLTNNNNNNESESEDYCFKKINATITKYDSSGQITNSNTDCWNLVLVKGDSHNSQDTMVARFINRKYKYACVRYYNYDTKEPLYLSENDDLVNPWSSITNSGIDIFADRPESDNQNNQFICVEINNNGIDVDDDGDLMGSPYAVYTETDEENPITTSGGTSDATTTEDIS